jgi:hypothetical protein
MTASPPLNGHKRPTMPVIGDWRPVTPDPEPVEEQRTSEPQPEPAVDTEVARARAWAEAEERRVAAEAAKEQALIKAQAEADAIRVKAEEDTRRLRLNNDKLERKSREEEAASLAKIAESDRQREESERARENGRRQAEAEKTSAAVQDGKRAKTAKSWRNAALGFAIACAIVALPVQMSAFYNPDAKWLLAAPVMLEGGAWVVLRGAAAAVDDRRPHWHYRLIAWVLAFIAGAVNLSHGLSHFDPATAIGTAFASLAGPGVWDLHEHGRIRRRDGALTRRERKTQAKAAKAEAARKAAEEKKRAADKAAADMAAAEAAEDLANSRAEEFPDVWDEAEKIAAAVGEVTVTEAVWARAYHNIKGCDPGESIESITARRAAEKRVQAALSGTPVSTLSKTTSAQRGVQTPRSGYKPVPPVRKKGDTTRYHRAAGRAHGDLLRTKNARQKDQ